MALYAIKVDNYSIFFLDEKYIIKFKDFISKEILFRHYSNNLIKFLKNKNFFPDFDENKKNFIIPNEFLDVDLVYKILKTKEKILIDQIPNEFFLMKI